MRVGFFTDTYFPQISGVATSIKTLKEELEKSGHSVYIFTTSDPQAQDGEDETIIRMPSIPFISFKDRRIVVSGMYDAYQQAKDLQLDIIHTHTEFGAGWLGKMVAKHLEIPIVHTYHTMYEDYLHYIANGHLIRPMHVKQASRAFCRNVNGIICPSERVVKTLASYGIIAEKRVIPTGVNLDKFTHQNTKSLDLKEQLKLPADSILLLSLSRLSYEKNIQSIIQGMPAILETLPQAQLIIVGDGPHKKPLMQLVAKLQIEKNVHFVGEVENQEVPQYYQATDYFVSASTSESQGLTYIEALAAGTRCVVKGNPYLAKLFDNPSLGMTFEDDEAFAATLINYVQHAVEEIPSLREQKLYEISSHAFCCEVVRFYRECIDSYQKFQFLCEGLENRSGTSRLAVRLFKRS